MILDQKNISTHFNKNSISVYSQNLKLFQTNRNFSRYLIDLLVERLVGATDWLLQQPETQPLKIGYFGSNTGAAAALIAATKRPDELY